MKCWFFHSFIGAYAVCLLVDAPLVVNGEEDEISDLSASPSLTEVLEEDEASELTAVSRGLDSAVTAVDLVPLVDGTKPYDAIDIKVTLKKLLVRKLRQVTGLLSCVCFFCVTDYI